jgi:YjbE family integral membrane protein
MDLFSAEFLVSVLQIIWIDILLSGDNAVVIALACRSLPAHQRKLGILLGAGTAVTLRIVFALIITFLLGVPYLRIMGGLLLFFIAVKLLVGEGEDAHDIEASDSLWKAVRTIAVADAVMSLDNVVAIAAASRGHPELFIFGLLLSIPLIMVGATLITALIARFPVFVWAGAALLGYIAAEMIVTDPAVLGGLAAALPQAVVPDPLHPPLGLKPSLPLRYGAAAIGALLVVAAGFGLAPQGGARGGQDAARPRRGRSRR